MAFTVMDRDKLSGNDFIGSANLALPEIIKTAPEADPETGLRLNPIAARIDFALGS